MKPIVLLTDFGRQDTYVGQLKGAILSVDARAQIVDLSHDCPAHNVCLAAYALAYTYAIFPNGSVFVCVVDPGVGTARRAVVMRAEGRFFLAPDNGLLSIVAMRSRKAELRELRGRKFWRSSVSSTFHGRDIFGPVGGHLARRPSIFGRLGPRIRKIRKIADADPVIRDSFVEGRVIHIDRFGNLVTNIESHRVPQGAQVRWRNKRINKISPSYGMGRGRRVIAIENSMGLLELAMRERSCGRTFGARVGEKVRVEWKT